MGLSIVLIEPRIPQNTGNIARLCAATDTTLHLIQPLGFHLTDAALKRSGMDYWHQVDLWVHPHWRAFRESISRERCLYFSAHGEHSYLGADYTDTSVLVLGSETAGMPVRIREKHPERVFRIPMVHGTRSLNVATAAGIVLYQGMQVAGINPETASSSLNNQAERFHE